MSAPTVGVCGFGRCGSSMLMAALEAGGVQPVDGSSQGGYENPGFTDLLPDALAGRSVKVLDAVLHNLMPRPHWWRLIWLTRDHHQQAKSQVKFLRAVTNLHIAASAVKALEASYADDEPRALAMLDRLGLVMVRSYEYALAEPGQFCLDIAGFLAPEFYLNPVAASRVIHTRNARCLPNMAFEATGVTP